MANTFYGYAERDEDSQINWAQIGKNMSDMLANEEKIREEKRQAIDKASTEYGQKLSDPPQGDHKGLNQWALEYANDAQQARLMQDKLLKSGQLKTKDYLVMRQNITDGTSQAFNLMQDYQDEYKNKMERMKTNTSQDLETWLMAEAEGFSNFSNSKLYINPTDGSVSVAKMITGPDGVKKMSENPNDFTTVNGLKNRIKATFDRFDVSTNVGNYVDTLGDQIRTLTDIKNKYQRGTLTEVFDQTLNDNLPADEKGVIMKFEEAETKMLSSMLDNEYSVSSILTNSVNFEPTTKKQYTFTWSEEERNANPNLILLKNDPKSGNPMPEFTEDQRKTALEYLRTQARLMYDKKETVSVVPASEKPQQQQWQWLASMQKKEKENLYGLWQDLYTGNANTKKAALEAILGSPTMKDQGLVDIRFSDGGKTVNFKFVQDGKTIERPISTRDSKGNLKNPKDWFKSGTEVFGDLTVDELNKWGKGSWNTEVGNEDFGSLSSSRSVSTPTKTTSDPRGAFKTFVSDNARKIEDAVGSTEESAVISLTNLFANSGFTFEESGAGDNITITAPDGATKQDFPVDYGVNDDPSNNKSVSSQMMEWIKAHSTDEQSKDWLGNSGSSSVNYEKL